MASFNVKEYTLPGQHIREFARGTANAQDEVLQVAVKEYVPKDNPEPKEGDVTIIGAHANGFPKELYEALWDDLHVESKKRNFRIRSIIITDAAWQGQSGLINEGKLGIDPGWQDCTRDLLAVINHLRPPPPLIGVAHSFGASCLASLSFIHPRLFTTLVLIDPVISRFSSTPGSISRSPAGSSLYRREIWPSRSEAEKSFEKSPFYKAWDTRVLDAWKAWGIRPLEDGKEEGKVTLTTSKSQECATFFRPSWDAYDKQGAKLLRPDLVPDLDPSLNETHPTWPLYRAEGAAILALLPNIRPPVLYIVGGTSRTSAPEIRKTRLEMTGSGPGGSGGVARGRVQEIAFEDKGHLLPMEIPTLCAEKAAPWIGMEVERWARENDEYKLWAKKSGEEKSTLGKDWYEYVPRPKRSDPTGSGYGRSKM